MILMAARCIMGRKKEICFDGSMGTPHMVALDNTPHNKNDITYLMVISLAMVTSLAKRDHLATPQSQHFKNEKCL